MTFSWLILLGSNAKMRFSSSYFWIFPAKINQLIEQKIRSINPFLSFSSDHFLVLGLDLDLFESSWFVFLNSPSPISSLQSLKDWKRWSESKIFNEIICWKLSTSNSSCLFLKGKERQADPKRGLQFEKLYLS